MTQCPAGTYTYTVRAGDSLWLIAQRFQTTTMEIVSANPTIDINNLSIGQVICVPQKRGQKTARPNAGCISKEEQALSNLMRLLWTQHVYWTRMAILSIAFGLPDAEYVSKRLLRNATDFGAALKPFYGADIAGKLAELLTNHLTIAAELVTAAKAGDSAAAADAEKRWYENADQIAVFLGEINPYWSAQAWQKMLYDHLAMTKTEAVDILTQKYEDSISVFERIEQQALAMADMMTQGLTKQFSSNFG